MKYFTCNSAFVNQYDVLPGDSRHSCLLKHKLALFKARHYRRKRHTRAIRPPESAAYPAIPIRRGALSEGMFSVIGYQDRFPVIGYSEEKCRYTITENREPNTIYSPYIYQLTHHRNSVILISCKFSFVYKIQKERG